MEPWYESTEITPAEVDLIMRQMWFHRELHSDNNPLPLKKHLIDPNEELCKLLYNDKRKISPPYRHITFEALREHPLLFEHAERILSDEIEKEGSFGSHRGFYTFCREPLLKAYAKGVVQECWAKPILARFAQRWLEHHYAYGGNGFLHAKTDFETKTIVSA